MDTRTRDIATVEQWRRVRMDAIGQSAAGHLARVIADPSPEQGFVYVVKLLDVHPRLGKVSGRRLMARLGIGSFARVSELTSAQKNALLADCGEST